MKPDPLLQEGGVVVRKELAPTTKPKSSGLQLNTDSIALGISSTAATGSTADQAVAARILVRRCLRFAGVDVDNVTGICGRGG